MRPIDADALLKHRRNFGKDYSLDPVDKNIDDQLVDLRHVLNAPTLDYAPVRHGYWKHEEPVKDDGQKPFVCSMCCLRHPRYGDVDKAYFSYCPWCGTPMDAEMDGGKDDG